MARTRLALLPKKVRENWTEKHRNVARKIFWKDFSILDGLMSVSVKLVRWRKVQQSTDSATVQNGSQ